MQPAERYPQNVLPIQFGPWESGPQHLGKTLSATGERIQNFFDCTQSLTGEDKGDAQAFYDRLFQSFSHYRHKDTGSRSRWADALFHRSDKAAEDEFVFDGQRTSQAC